MNTPAPIPVATLLGDLVGSRQVSERRQLHDQVRRALAEASAGSSPRRPLWVTAGDEFQGTFDRVGDALHAALLIRLSLYPHDVRFGVGWGTVHDLDEDGVQDGPGWWSARRAILEVAQVQARGATGAARTAYHRSEETATTGPDPAAITAALLCRDQLFAEADERDIAILQGLLRGDPQGEIAQELDISASAVSQRIRRRGWALLLQAHALLREV